MPGVEKKTLPRHFHACVWVPAFIAFANALAVDIVSKMLEWYFTWYDRKKSAE